MMRLMGTPYRPHDKWAHKAKEQGYRARSVFKLQELDERFKIIKKGYRILDVGAAPGSWLQYVHSVMGPQGKAVGLDLQPIEPIGALIATFVCDITDPEAVERVLAETGVNRFDVVLSDLAPSTSGIKDRDQWLSVELSRHVVAIAEKWLKPGGTVVMKILRGADFDDFLKEIKKKFSAVKVVRPPAVRTSSSEVYLVCSGKKS